MDPTPTPTPTPAPASTEPPSTAEAPPPPQPETPSTAAQPPYSSAPSTSEVPPPPSSAPSSPSPTPTPPAPPQQQTHHQQLQPQQRPPIPQNRPQSAFPHFAQALPSPPTPSPASSFTPTSPSPSTLPRGGLAIGVPAHHHPRPPQPPVTLSPFGPSAPFGRPYSPLPRTSVGGSEQSTISTTQVRQPIQGIHSIGMIGSLSTGAQIRPSGIPGQHPQRLGQPSLRATSPSANQSLSSQQKFHGHGLPRAPSITSPSSSSSAPQSSQSFLQPLASAQGKQMHAASLPSSSYKPQMMSQASQQRPHHLQPHNQSLAMASHHQQAPSSQQQQQKQKQQQKQQLIHQQLQQQASMPHQPQEHHGQQHLALGNQQSIPQQQAARVTQKSNFPAVVQSGVVQSGVSTPIVITDAAESGNHIVSKRSIHELVSQIDPSEKLDPEVEDALVEIADDFIESITTFACSLAKHRKSTTLEAKDILLHVERNWNITLPGFGGDEIKCYKKQPTNDVHKERLAVIKKSMGGTSDAGITKNPAVGQAAVNRKAHAAKAPATTGQAERSS